MLKIKLIILCFMMMNTCFALNMDFDLQTSGNCFLKFQQPKYRPTENTNDGKQTIDNSGISFDVGITWNYLEKMSVRTKYRFKRKCSYSYPKSSTPFVFGPNTYWNKTESSSFTLEMLYRFDAIGIVIPYMGIGINLNHINNQSKDGHIHGGTGDTLYISDWWNYGNKNLIGLILPIGVYLPITNNFMLDLNINYTLLGFKKWNKEEVEDNTTDNQNLSGIYFNLGLCYKINFK